MNHGVKQKTEKIHIRHTVSWLTGEDEGEEAEAEAADEAASRMGGGEE